MFTFKASLHNYPLPELLLLLLLPLLSLLDDPLLEAALFLPLVSLLPLPLLSCFPPELFCFSAIT